VDNGPGRSGSVLKCPSSSKLKPRVVYSGPLRPNFDIRFRRVRFIRFYGFTDWFLRVRSQTSNNKFWINYSSKQKNLNKVPEKKKLRIINSLRSVLPRHQQTKKKNKKKNKTWVKKNKMKRRRRRRKVIIALFFIVKSCYCIGCLLFFITARWRVKKIKMQRLENEGEWRSSASVWKDIF
jgi:hypothetical protein